MKTFYEFFAGSGMARAGLGDSWTCVFANDFDHKKGAVYQQNWGKEDLFVGDVKTVTQEQLSKNANLVWASFPCQDLSLAGAGAGLKGERSGTFWPFWSIIKQKISSGAAPEIIALENVCGMLTSHKGDDFAAICSAFNDIGYRYGAMVVDAALFLPQSRPRLFIIGVRDDIPVGNITTELPSKAWHTRTLLNAYNNLCDHTKSNWVWWDLPEPKQRASVFADLIEENPDSVKWHTPQETQQIMAMMTDVNLAKVEAAKNLSLISDKKVVGTIYKRTRTDSFGIKAQRAEVRFDDVAGCLRTPGGGSSRQVIMVIEKGTVKTRLISSRETARLMGLPDDYILPKNYNEAYHLTGDGVVVPVVSHIATHIFDPVMEYVFEDTAGLLKQIA
ncbi:DNA cytosine methyltransferase [Cronobacter sakazakii]|nr:DNA cytosine methyltransferase [Cronobacter sakazakii]ELY4406093.1 DNA cytosine methyltransferase [Cronobacter sakazakii]ELY4465417.1 DNA cytosine methyltransferase [Cronobacter sakazakii]ELY5895045.1 DNA cytosine methyltransferase [Cronobacter sakazakii]